jgi:hypothetical protein
MRFNRGILWHYTTYLRRVSMGTEYIELVVVSGKLEAEIICGMLQAYGVDAMMSQEAAASIYGLGVGPTAEVDILVPENQLEEAQRIFDDYQNGRLESDEVT